MLRPIKRGSLTEVKQAEGAPTAVHDDIPDGYTVTATFPSRVGAFRQARAPARHGGELSAVELGGRYGTTTGAGRAGAPRTAAARAYLVG